MVKLVNELNGQLVSGPNLRKQITCDDNQPLNLGEDTMMALTNMETIQQTVSEDKVQAASEHKSTSRSINKQKKGLNLQHKVSNIANNMNM